MASSWQFPLARSTIVATMFQKDLHIEGNVCRVTTIKAWMHLIARYQKAIWLMGNMLYASRPRIVSDVINVAWEQHNHVFVDLLGGCIFSLG